MKRALLVLALVTACSNPPFSLKYRLTRGDSQQCIGDTGDVVTSCQDVTFLCSAYLSIRIYNPSDKTAPYISMCVPIMDRNNSLCAISTPPLDVPDMDIESQTLAVEMALFPESEVPIDPDTGQRVCPQVEYAADGLPMPQDCPNGAPCVRVPAVGGRTYYNPGDEETVVDLGCTDLGQLTDPAVCGSGSRITVTASVNDFDNLVSSVDKAVADVLNVSIGEPQAAGDTFTLTPEFTRDLDPTGSTTPAWAATLTDLDITSTACVAVREDGAQTTTTLRCYPAAGKTMLDLEGAYMSKQTLGQIITDAGMLTFPDAGLTIGVVVDDNFEPLAGQPVSCGGCTIQNLDATHAGVFVSPDAPYGTTFSIQSPDASASSGIGGLVQGKVTVVVLQYKDLKPN